MTNLEQRMEEIYWADKIADKLVKTAPKKERYVCAAGISPSGSVHIGNFRDIITSEVVCRALRDKGFKSKLIFSWDDYDPFRKVPAGIPKEYKKYLGMPLSEIPDPLGCHESYATHFEKEFEEGITQLGINAKFIYQSKRYKSNAYYSEIKKALQKRKEIDTILAKFRTKGRETKKKTGEAYYPFQVYCNSCRKNTNVKIVSYDGKDKITYSCKCGYKESVDISKQNAGKLEWKVDWLMRWGYEGVDFEPGGEDHAVSGGSFEVASHIIKEIYGKNPPLFQGYGFIGIEGISKMSGSTGSGITPKELLKIYEPELLRWIFTRSNPKKTLTFSFESQIIKQYDEFDREIKKFYRGSLSRAKKRAILFASIKEGGELPNILRIPFRQVASFGQIAQGNFQELKSMFTRSGQEFDEDNLKSRYVLANNWVNKYAPSYKIELKKKRDEKYFSGLSKEEQEQISQLAKSLKDNWNLERLTTLVYNIPKKPRMGEERKKEAQRRFFRNVYQMMIGSNTGPRLPTFLLAIGKDKIIKLLEQIK